MNSRRLKNQKNTHTPTTPPLITYLLTYVVVGSSVVVVGTVVVVGSSVVVVGTVVVVGSSVVVVGAVLWVRVKKKLHVHTS